MRRPRDEAGALAGPSRPAAGGDPLIGGDPPVGVATGRARVLAATAPAPRLSPGTVLIVDRLPAAWVPLMGTPAGVVAETGGPLCAAATLLRERGVPAVFGVDGATAALRDGDVVAVEPLRGAVRLVARGLPAAVSPGASAG